MCGFQGTQKPYTISGDNGERDPPVPIPNTEVKPFSADGTWLETIWESRTLPDSTKKSLRRCLGLFLCASRQVLLLGRFQANVQHCTWLGSPMCAASGGSSTWGNTWESRRKGAEEALCIRYVYLSGRLQANVQHCTWSRNRARPAGRFSEMKAEITKERPGEGVNESP